MQKRNIATIAILGLTLTGCQTLQKFNPFSHKTKTAPCNAIASLGDVSIICDGKEINITAPTPEELMKLRGPIDPSTGRSYGIIEERRSYGFIQAAP